MLVHLLFIYNHSVVSPHTTIYSVMTSEAPNPLTEFFGPPQREASADAPHAAFVGKNAFLTNEIVEAMQKESNPISLPTLENLA